MPPKNNRPLFCRRCGGQGHRPDECVVPESQCQEQQQNQQQTQPQQAPLPPHSVPYIDTHMHVDLLCDQLRVANWGEALAATKKMHLPPTCAAIICTICDCAALISSSFSQREDLIKKFDDVYRNPIVYLAVGLHPHNSKYMSDRVREKIVDLLTTTTSGDSVASSAAAASSSPPAQQQQHHHHQQVISYGEIGLDEDSVKKGGSALDVQLERFVEQVQLANALVPHLPVQLHLRFQNMEKNLDMFLPQLQQHKGTGCFHFHGWMDGSLATAKKIVAALGEERVVFGLGGGICAPAVRVVQQKEEDGDDDENDSAAATTWTYPCTKRFEQFLAWLPLHLWVLESDSPYLAPASAKPPPPPGGVSLGGGGNDNKKPRGPYVVNHPGNIPFVAAAIAHAKKMSIDQVLLHALANSLRVYHGIRAERLGGGVSEELMAAVKPLMVVPKTVVSAAVAAVDDDDVEEKKPQQQQQQQQRSRQNHQRQQQQHRQNRRAGAAAAAVVAKKEDDEKPEGEFPSLGDFYQ